MSSPQPISISGLARQQHRHRRSPPTRPVLLSQLKHRLGTVIHHVREITHIRIDRPFPQERGAPTNRFRVRLPAQDEDQDPETRPGVVRTPLVRLARETPVLSLAGLQVLDSARDGFFPFALRGMSFLTRSKRANRPTSW